MLDAVMASEMLAERVPMSWAEYQSHLERRSSWTSVSLDSSWTRLTFSPERVRPPRAVSRR